MILRNPLRNIPPTLAIRRLRLLGGGTFRTFGVLFHNLFRASTHPSYTAFPKAGRPRSWHRSAGRFDVSFKQQTKGESSPGRWVEKHRIFWEKIGDHQLRLIGIVVVYIGYPMIYRVSYMWCRISFINSMETSLSHRIHGIFAHIWLELIVNVGKYARILWVWLKELIYTQEI